MIPARQTSRSKAFTTAGAADLADWRRVASDGLADRSAGAVRRQSQRDPHRFAGDGVDGFGAVTGRVHAIAVGLAVLVGRDGSGGTQLDARPGEEIGCRGDADPDDREVGGDFLAGPADGRQAVPAHQGVHLDTEVTLDALLPYRLGDAVARGLAEGLEGTRPGLEEVDLAVMG
jgi:hypothetical protein